MKRVILAAALAFLATAASAAEDPQSPPVPEQQAQVAPALSPVAAVVVVHCGKIVAVAVSDTSGDLHPLDVTAVSDATLKNILTHIPKQLVARIHCKSDDNNQRSTTL